jgi:hypothetical protein
MLVLAVSAVDWLTLSFARFLQRHARSPCQYQFERLHMLRWPLLSCAPIITSPMIMVPITATQTHDSNIPRQQQHSPSQYQLPRLYYVEVTLAQLRANLHLPHDVGAH